MLYFLFFLSGLSGLIYQVIWVRVFGNVFGNTIYSASLVVAIFMLGLGAGSYLAGAWADRRYASASALHAYAVFEAAIALLALAVSLVLPHLGSVSSTFSTYVRDGNGWYALSAASYVARAVVTAVLLMPITLLMGGTLTLLIRHVVRGELDSTGWRIAVLYGINTAGAALGCFLTDFALVPAIGVRDTQFVAVLLNAVAAGGAWVLALRSENRDEPVRSAQVSSRAADPRADDRPPLSSPRSAIVFIAVALALSGFASMGMEIVWFRHVTILLGGFRAVFSLLLTIILVGIGAGSLIASVIYRRTGHAAPALMLVQAFFVLASVAGLANANGSEIDRTFAAGVASTWVYLRPILLEAGFPALMMGFSFPLANAIVQREEQTVGSRAGFLYLANTAGAVAGSLAAGYLLLPWLGIQGSASLLLAIAALAALPLAIGSGASKAAAGLVAATAVLPLLLPGGYILVRALPAPVPGERLLARNEGLTEVISVTERPGYERILFTNGHPMSSTARFSQRYMRALAHIPLLSMERPESVLVIGFGVGNTAHAATLHPTVRRVDVADLSRDVIAHADYFGDFNGHVLRDPRVTVYVNDGRHHLQVQPPGTYDLVTLEPPPIAFAGVAALYSREFYQLARSRLKPGGYMSQWLPSYQESGPTTLAMIHAFIDVFPNAVLLSGAQADLLLVGTSADRIEIDPDRVAKTIASAPALQQELRRLDLGSPRDIVGTFLGSPKMLADGTAGVEAANDDRPIQEYSSGGAAPSGVAVPNELVDLRQVAAWCPRCFVEGEPAPVVAGLDTYLWLIDRAYAASPAEALQARTLADREGRWILGSAYLGAIVPETVDVHDYLGITFARQNRMDGALAEFERSLQIDPRSAPTWWHFGAALASTRDIPGAIDAVRRSLELDPANAQARSDLAVLERMRSGTK